MKGKMRVNFVRLYLNRVTKIFSGFETRQSHRISLTRHSFLTRQNPFFPFKLKIFLRAKTEKVSNFVILTAWEIKPAKILPKKYPRRLLTQLLPPWGRYAIIFDMIRQMTNQSIRNHPLNIFARLSGVYDNMSHIWVIFWKKSEKGCKLMWNFENPYEQFKDHENSSISAVWVEIKFGVPFFPFSTPLLRIGHQYCLVNYRQVTPHSICNHP